jgi:hypothetical protein
MTTYLSDDGNAYGLSRDSKLYDAHVISTLLIFNDFKHTTLRNAEDPTS